ncbi:aldehyde dehydrogenase family protein [Actinomycetospora endophytica]|uniref:Aldehyde dehydrogenase n=1 Tax=Actinomycetospora endophytica TaxID=2291215 RepID=A0ABS8P8M0_9PSEU|nr:aldehyde dehydrogenase family protein [Actinomycetospora endophytica]MCD2194586.1 aldehyde dehydrogenase family protein [Actinomycetospora endophytica]
MTSVASRPVPARPSPEEHVEQVVARLRSTFAGGRTRDLRWRRQQLRGIERLCAEQEPAIAAAMAADLGRSAHDTWLGEIASTRGEAAFARKHLRRWNRKRRVHLPVAQQPGSAHYRYEPLGTVLVIGPWNYPVYLCLGPLVGALAAGNTAVLKPSEHAPAVSALLAELLPRYVDPDAVAVVEGEADATQALLAQGLDLAFFTGGPEIGKKVMEGAAKHLTPVVLELGGKCPAIVAADADLAVTARRLVWTKLLNSGQTCIAPDYLLVEESVRDALVTEILGCYEQFRVGEPAGLRIVNDRQHDRLTGLLEGHGGRVVLGGGADRDALTMEPTVVVDPDKASSLMTEEIFGPILPIVSVSSVDDAVRHVNAGPKPLAAYVFSSSRRTHELLTAAVPSGGTVINHAMMHCLVPQLPFGGVGTSGMGAYHGRWGFEAFSHRKAVMSKSTKPDPGLLYPPYSDREKALMRKLL